MAKSASNYKIIKRADGRWFARVMVNGETICIYGKTQTEVRSELKQKLWELEQAKAAQLNNYVHRPLSNRQLISLNKYSHLLPKHQKACMEKLEAIYHP